VEVLATSARGSVAWTSIGFWTRFLVLTPGEFSAVGAIGFWARFLVLTAGAIAQERPVQLLPPQEKLPAVAAVRD
jgi:hypothetical protein